MVVLVMVMVGMDRPAGVVRLSVLFVLPYTIESFVVCFL